MWGLARHDVLVGAALFGPLPHALVKPAVKIMLTVCGTIPRRDVLIGLALFRPLSHALIKLKGNMMLAVCKIIPPTRWCLCKAHRSYSLRKLCTASQKRHHFTRQPLQLQHCRHSCCIINVPAFKNTTLTLFATAHQVSFACDALRRMIVNLCLVYLRRPRMK